MQDSNLRPPACKACDADQKPVTAVHQCSLTTRQDPVVSGSFPVLLHKEVHKAHGARIKTVETLLREGLGRVGDAEICLLYTSDAADEL